MIRIFGVVIAFALLMAISGAAGVDWYGQDALREAAKQQKLYAAAEPDYQSKLKNKCGTEFLAAYEARKKQRGQLASEVLGEVLSVCNTYEFSKTPSLRSKIKSNCPKFLKDFDDNISLALVSFEASQQATPVVDFKARLASC